MGTQSGVGSGVESIRPSAKPRTAQVLLVDHREVVRAGLRAWLAERRAYRLCGEAATAPAAVDAASLTRPDFVVLDPLTPGAGCVELIRQLRHASPSSQVLVFAQEPSELAAAAIAAGARAVVLTTDPPEILSCARGARGASPVREPACRRGEVGALSAGRPARLPQSLDARGSAW